MTTISADARIATFINVFTVDPADADRLLEHQRRDLHAFIAGLPGFISSTWHRSTDGTTIVNYAQWENAEAMRAAQQHPDFARHNAEARALARRQEGHFYAVVDTATATRPRP